MEVLVLVLTKKSYLQDCVVHMPLNSNSKNSGVPNTLFGPNSKLSILFVSCQISAINFHQI